MFIAPEAIGLIQIPGLHRQVGADGAPVAHEGADWAGEVLQRLDCFLAGRRWQEPSARAELMKTIECPVEDARQLLAQQLRQLRLLLVVEAARKHQVEPALRADFALVQAFLADYLGNLGYALTARNFNPVIAMAADTVIASADNIVPVGVISPDHVGTPAPVVDYLIANA